jgi:hypothetical protein
MALVSGGRDRTTSRNAGAVGPLGTAHRGGLPGAVRGWLRDHRFTYLSAPTVSGISPTSAPQGTTVTISAATSPGHRRFLWGRVSTVPGCVRHPDQGHQPGRHRHRRRHHHHRERYIGRRPRRSVQLHLGPMTAAT